MVLEELKRLVDGQVQDVGDRQVVVPDLEGRLVESLPGARLARHVDVGEEVHLHLLDAVPFAGLAAPAFHVEAEPPGRVAVHPRFGEQSEEVADQVEQLRVGRGVRPGRAADGALIDVDDLVDLRKARDLVVGPRDDLAPVEGPRHGGIEDLVHQGALAGAGDARHADEEAEGELGGDVLEVVLLRARPPRSSARRPAASRAGPLCAGLRRDSVPSGSASSGPPRGAFPPPPPVRRGAPRRGRSR